MMQCNHSVALRSFFHQVVWNGPVKLALIGSGCSVATEPTADISHFYNITQVSFTVRNTLLAIPAGNDIVNRLGALLSTSSSVVS